MSSTATPMWSIRPNMAPVYAAGGGSSAAAPRARPGGSRPARRPRPRAARGSAPWSRRRRWISRPGAWKASASGSPWWRSLQANISTAIEAPPSPTPARAIGPGLLDQALEQHRAAGREQHHRRDQVGAAAVVLLRHRRPGRRFPARRRRSPCARPRGRRRGRGPSAPPSPAPRRAPGPGPRAAPRRKPLAQRRGGHQRRANRGEDPPVLERQPRRRHPPPHQRQHGHRLGQFHRAAQARHPRRRSSAPAPVCAPRRPRRARRGRAPRRPSGSARGSAGRCEAPSRRVEAALPRSEAIPHLRRSGLPRCAQSRHSIRGAVAVPPGASPPD